ncbi:hypothetical protein PsorP6_011092 [Peronosclerospora sorghi]|uniref:Uncharacterized protein n=1 Tax=Peronosclerospora sorghi TaxID=230839 RepID=A0ACC0VWY6_9STRA|nr:hypothetical protein PsorP6_011092 [Peronosclerospora sorghi]
MNWEYGLEHVPLMVLYAYSLYYCYLTVVEPYAQAMKEMEEAGFVIGDAGIAGWGAGCGDVVPRRCARSSYATINDYTAMVEHEKRRHRCNPFLPGMVPLMCHVGTVMTHGLMVLFQTRSVRVKAFIKYTPVSCLDEATFVMVVPRSFKGKSSIIEITRPRGTSAGKPYFLFQKHKYVAEEDASDKSTVLFRKLKAPVHEPVQFYSAQSRGLSEREAEARLDLMSLAFPSQIFADMFKQQPLDEQLIVFQIFSVCLYMLDEYWQYLLFTLAMSIMFEGVTVMSRLKNLQTLCGMGDRAREVYVHREKTWKKVNYDRFVPGDVIFDEAGDGW